MCAGLEPPSGESGRWTGEARGELGRERAGPYPSNGNFAATSTPSGLESSGPAAPSEDDTGTIADAWEPDEAMAANASATNDESAKKSPPGGGVHAIEVVGADADKRA